MSAENVATETARNILAPVLARAVWLSAEPRVESRMLHSASYARYLAAILAALTEPAAFDALKLHAEGLAPSNAPSLCRECSDRAGEHWRRWAEKQLGDTPAVRAATDQDLRRLLTERLRAPAGHAERIANLEHTIRVMAEATHEGDPAAVRMHAEHALAPAPALEVVGAEDFDAAVRRRGDRA